MFAKGALVSFLMAAGAMGRSGGVSDEPKCLDVWYYVAEELKQSFIDNDGLCTDLARQSIRLPFHDCFTDGGCDGSTVLTDECTTRFENENLIPICIKLADMADKYKVGVADLVNFAGAIGVKSCPGGPFTAFWVGREDNATATPEGQLPPPFFDGPTLVKIFGDKGFTPDELVALIGSHSAGKNHTGVPFDTTDGQLDSRTYYSETRDGFAPTTLPSDLSLAHSPETSAAWDLYAVDQEAWEKDYIEGWNKLIVMGNDISELVDCSEIIHEVFEDDRVPCDGDASLNC